MIKTDRHVLGFVLVDEEHPAEQVPLGIEDSIGWPVGTDFRRFRGGQLLLLDVM